MPAYPSSSPAPAGKPGSGAGKLVIVLGVLVGLPVALAILVVVVAAVVVLVLAGREHRAERGESASEGIVELPGSLEVLEADGDGGAGGQGAGEGDLQSHGTRGVELGKGTRPWLCCGSEGCVIAFQRETMSRSSVHVRMLSSDLAPMGEAVELTQESENGRWPTCFVRDDGSALVLWQDAGSPFDMDDAVELHRTVVTREGKVEKRHSLAMRQLVVLDEFEASYSASRAGDKVIVAWNDQKGVEASLMVAILDMDGAAFKQAVPVHSMPTVHQSGIACSQDRCIVAWVKPSLPMNHVQKLSIVTTAGDVVEKELTAFDRGILIAKRSVVPTADGVVLAWVETNDVGESRQMAAGWDWKGKVLFEPVAIDAFAKQFFEGDGLSYVCGSAAQSGAVLVRIVEDEATADQVLSWVELDSKGKVANKGEAGWPDADMDQAVVFRGPAAKPILVYETGDFDSDLTMYAIAI